LSFKPLQIHHKIETRVFFVRPLTTNTNKTQKSSSLCGQVNIELGPNKRKKINVIGLRKAKFRSISVSDEITFKALNEMEKDV
jgi:hypothetical protein